MDKLNGTKEYLFEQALKEIKKGSNLEEATKNLSLVSQIEIQALLKVSQSLFDIPKKNPPTPLMQRKYASLDSTNFLFSWFKFLKFAAVSTAIILIVTVLAGTSYKAANSLPGDVLFSVKKTTEQLRVKIASSPTKKANLQLSITQKRLNETQKLITSSSEPVKTQLAIQELINQTNTALKSAQQVAEAKVDPKISKPIVTELVNLTANQKKLITQVDPENIFTESSQIAAEQALIQIAQIKHYVEAANNEQVLVDLNAKESKETTQTIESNSSEKKTLIENKTNNTTNSTKILNATPEENPKILDETTNFVQGSFIVEDPDPKYKP